MTISAAVRKTHVAALRSRGFRVAPSLPLVREEIGDLRPPEEIAARLMALDALFSWVVYSEAQTPAAKLRAYVSRNRLSRALTPAERKIFAQGRTAAHRAHVFDIGWRLENMWPLAWVLGFPRAPRLDGKMITRPTVLAIVAMLPRLRESIDVLLDRARPRPAAVVRRLEDRFYCAHNAVRSAQLGGRTVPADFDPIAGGGVIHERRHALTWCLSPGTRWDDTELGT